MQCPICSRSYPLKFIEEHASTCVSGGVSSDVKSSAAERASQRKQTSKPKATRNAFSVMSKCSKKNKKGIEKSSAKSSELNGGKHIKKKQKRGSSNFGRPRKELQVSPWIKDHRLSGQTKWGEKGKILGWNLTSGLSTVRGRNRVKSGDSLKIFRQSSTSDFVRFGFSETSIIGKLEQDVASFLGPLLDNGLITASAMCQYCPENLNYLNTIQLLVQINVHDPLIFSENPSPINKENLILRKSVFKLARWIFPIVSATCKGLAGGSNNSSVMIDDAQHKSKDAIEKVGNDVNEIAKLEDEVATGNLDKENSPSNSQVDALLEETLIEAGSCKNEYHDNMKLIPAIQPSKSLNVDLRAYQRDALSWMVDRETLRSPTYEMKNPSITRSKSKTQELLNVHPLWLECRFQDQSAHNTYIYINPYSQTVQMKKPPVIQECRGGILADEMGMGKTIEVLSLLAKDKDDGFLADAKHEGGKGTSIKDEVNMHDGKEIPRDKDDRLQTLIVVPMSVLAQWGNEIRSHVRGLTHYTYYSNDKDVELHRLKQYDVVLTTYGTISHESQKYFVQSEQSASPSCSVQATLLAPRRVAHSSSCPLFTIKWRRVVLDEAHTIKNRSTLVAQGCNQIDATRRWCVTGTPMQNGIQDLYSLIKFLNHQPWSVPLWWNRVIKKPFDDGDEKAKERLRAVLGPIILRRTKDTIDHTTGKSIVTLPKRSIYLHPVDFSKAESEFYQSLYQRSKAEFDGYVASGTLANNYATILTLLLRLRQACDHPFLVLGKSSGGAGVNEGKKKYVSKLYRQFMSNAHGKSINGEKREAKESLTSSSGISNPALASQPEFIRNLFMELEKDGVSKMECPVCLDPPDNGVLTPCGHLLCRECLFGSLQYFGGAKCPVCRAKVNMKTVLPINDTIDVTAAPTMDDLQSNGKTIRSAKLDAMVKILKSKLLNSSISDNVANVLVSSRRGVDICHDVEKSVSNSPGTSYKPSDGIRSDQTPSHSPAKHKKAVIFSQWTYMLDLISFVLKREKISFVRLDGSMSQAKREKAVKEFKTEDHIQVMVMSLKAGGLGLNLTCASLVLLMDLWWNPAVEDQAINRCHRIGQIREVEVYRMIVDGSCEQKMIQIHEKKNKLSRSLMLTGNNMGNSMKSGRLDIDDLKTFFT